MGCGLSCLYENHAPWKCGLCSYNLAVHEVAETYHCCEERCCNGNVVKCPHHCELCLPYIEQQGYYHSQCASVACQSFVTAEYPAVGTLLYRQEHLNRVRKVVVGLVEQAMSQSCSYEYSCEAIDKKRVEQFITDSTFLVQFLYYVVCSQKADDPA